MQFLSEPWLDSIPPHWLRGVMLADCLPQHQTGRVRLDDGRELDARNVDHVCGDCLPWRMAFGKGRGVFVSLDAGGVATIQDSICEGE